MSLMSVLAALTSLLLFSGFTIAGIVAPDCAFPSQWNWTFNSLNQNACTVAAYLGSTCNQGSYTIDPLRPGYMYLSQNPGAIDDGNLCRCSTVMYSLMSACGACQGGDWSTWSEYSSNCITIFPVSWFPNPVPSGTHVPHWALLDVTLEDKWNPNKSYTVGDSPEIFPGGLIGPMGDFLYPSTSTWDKRDARGVASFVGFIIAIWVALGIFISAITFFCQRRRQMRVPPSSSTVSDNSQVLHRESAVSGASQAQSGGSPVNGGSSSHSRFGSMGGKQVSSVGSSGFIGGFQAASIVSPINVTSQEPLASPSSAFAVHSPSQPHMAEDRQPVAGR